MSNPYRTHVFVSYSHKDGEWLTKLREVLAPDIRNDRIGYWDDRELEPGNPWFQAIIEAINHARVAVLLVSPNFLASRFIMEEEVPRILKAVDDGLTVLWLPLFGNLNGPDSPPQLKPLAELQAASPSATPLAQLNPDSLKAALLDVCRRIQKSIAPSHIPRNLPFSSLGELFKGREDDLAVLEAALRHLGSAAVLQPHTITGMGGIGKTRLALEYAWRHADDFSAFLFVSCNSPDDLVPNMARLSEALELPEYTFGTQNDQYAAVLRWLQQNKRWLLILDNVDTPEAVGAVKSLVTNLHGGQVIITSRITGSKWGNSVRQVSLPVMPLEDAVALLLESTAGQRPERQDDVAQARALAIRLGCLPLALTHASAYLRERFESLAEYMAEFDARFSDVVAWYDPEAIEYDPQAKEKQADASRAATVRTVATTYFMSFGRLGPTEKALLRAASFLAPEPIPVGLFDGSPNNIEACIGLWCDETGEKPDSKSVRDALANLARYSLIVRGDGTFSVHRMEQAILRSRVSEERMPKWIELVCGVLARSAPGDTAENPSTWHVWDTLRPHVEVMMAAWKADHRVRPHTGLMDSLGQLYYGKGNYQQSLEIDETLLTLARVTHAPDSSAMAHRLLAYGESLHQLGRNEEAEAACRKSLAIRQALDGPESLRVAEDLNYLAMMVDAQGRVDEAETLQRQAIAIFEARVDKADKGSFAKSLNNLGLLVERKGQMEEAEILTRKAVQYAEEGFGPDHPKTLICVGTMAGLLEKKGDYAAAYTLLKRAREGCERTLGPDHPLTLRAFSQHAYGLRKTGFAAEAEPVDRHAVAGSIKVFGKSHPLVIHRSNNLVLTLVLLGKLEQAREVLAGNELSKFKPYENLTPRITFLRYVMELLSASGCELAADLLGRLKFHFARDPLPVFTNIDPYWDIGYFIDALQPKLKSLSVDLLRALLAVLNARARSSADVPLAALDEFPAWQNAISVPFE